MLVIRQARWKLTVGVLVTGFFFVGGGLMTADGVADGFGSWKDGVSAVACFLFGAMGAAHQLSCWLNPVEIRLDSKGFQVVGFQPTQGVAWSEIDRMFIMALRGHSSVWVVPRGPAARTSPLGRALPTQMTMSTKSLLAVMTEWRNRYAPDPDVVEPQPSPSGLGDCIAPAMVAKGDARIAYCHREAPHSEFDSGWRFFAAVRDEAWLESADDRSVFDLGLVCERNPELWSLIDAPIGSAFERDGDVGSFRSLPELSAA